MASNYPDEDRSASDGGDESANLPFRSAGADKGIQLTPPIRFTLERAIEYIAPDELVEATPENIRLRKRILDSGARRRAAKQLENA